jgi:TetR/AcrR family hemagglutinin/protease transcriptional regulator
MRREKLLACAMRVFGRKGVAFARHSDVAKEADVSLSTVFAYFPTRQALLKAVIDELSRWALALAKRAHRIELSPRQALYEHLVQLADLLENDPEYARVWLSWSMVVDKSLARAYLKLQRRVVGIIAETARRGQRDGSIAPRLNPEDVALLIIGGAYVIAQTKLTGRSRPELERFARMVVAGTLPSGD